MGRPGSKNLLLCLDAFGTLFRPRQSIVQQYGDVARAYGITNFNDEELATSFKNAFKSISKDHPNYGRATNMGSQQWWTNVIESTFAPFLSKDNPKLPAAIAPTLVHRFNSKEGYEMFSDAFGYLKMLSHPGKQQLLRRHDREQEGHASQRVVVGIITNSDDRVPDVLASFGLRVKPLRHQRDVSRYHPTNDAADIDFSIISYDVGYEKPDRRIFDAASKMLKQMLITEGHEDPDLSEWHHMYVGDELEKDALGAADAGWHGVLVDRDGIHQPTSRTFTGDDNHEQPFELVQGDRSVTVIRDFTALWDLTHEHEE